MTTAVACAWCDKRHPPLYHHEGQCTVKVAGLYCPNPALLHQGKPTLFCADHSPFAEPEPPVAKNRDPAFIEGTRSLAEELGLIPQPPPPSPGEIRYVESRSRPGHLYPMVWAPVSGWVHADDSCPAFTECWHRKEAANMTSLVVRNSEGAAIAERPVLLVEYDAAQISRGVDVKIAAKWAYRRPGDEGGQVEGVGVRGVEEGVRLLASHGEVIRVDDVVLVNQDDREAFFIATASRYVIGGDGVEVKLDSQRRGKRISKWERHSATWIRDHRGQSEEYFNKNWFEVGLVKAARNAALAMMPSNVKTALLKAGLDAQAELDGRAPPRQPEPPARQPGPVQSQPERRTIEQEPPPPAAATAGRKPASGAEMTAFWTEARKKGLVSDDVTAEAKRQYRGNGPLLLTADERAALLRSMTGEAAQPPAICDHEPMYTAEGIFACAKCGEALPEPAGAETLP